MLIDGSQEDYQAAAIRHYIDAKMLFDEERLDNAGHLIGFAAECAIKFRIASLGAAYDTPAVHLPDLLVAARKRLGERKSYVSMYEILKVDVFKNWHVSWRYSPDGKMTKPNIEEWITTTRRLFGAANIKVRLS